MINIFNVNTYLDFIFEKDPINLILLDLRNMKSIADFLIICHGQSNRQVTSIAKYVKTNLKKNDIELLSFEGINEGNWAILDYGKVIIHIFKDSFRTLYNLEGLWINAKSFRVKKNNNLNNYSYENVDFLDSTLVE